MPLEPCPDRRRLKGMAAGLRVLASLLLLSAAGVAAVWASQPSRTAAATGRVECGVERWTVKTLGDRPALLRSRPASIRSLVGRAAPEGLPQTRLPFERHIYRVTAAVTLVKPEDDGDLHIVLQDRAGRTMIAESPLASCGRSATSHRRSQIAAARARVRLCTRAKVTGVAFFDFQHGQTGVAPNAIELHPILDFRCLSGVVVDASATPAPAVDRPGASRISARSRSRTSRSLLMA
jgi:hypothetical protein